MLFVGGARGDILFAEAWYFLDVDELPVGSEQGWYQVVVIISLNGSFCLSSFDLGGVVFMFRVLRGRLGRHRVGYVGSDEVEIERKKLS